ncbi:MAG: hypothetical protein N3D16_12315, partial [Anaerolineales bacterium]|nr:hypothetical protein [Anaerolineales bacterium]
MDASELAAYLAPLLPYLIKFGIEAAKGAAGEAGKLLTREAWEAMEKLSEKIRHKAKTKPALQEALTDAANAPGDPDTQAALRLQLKKLLQEDPELLAEARSIFIHAEQGSVAVGGDIRQSNLTVGSENIIFGQDAHGNIVFKGNLQILSADYPR